MENELNVTELNTDEITVSQGEILFPNYPVLKQEALDLAERIAAVEVTDENIRTSKKLLAAVNKSVKDIEDRRIKIKNLMLEPYKLFEAQVKEIVGIVKEADDVVRQQVKALEEQERWEKENVLKDIFAKRIVHYSFRDLFSFYDFMKPKHLNKTTSIESVENEMIEFLEKLSRDLKVIETMPESENVLNIYIAVKDLAEALTLHKQQEERKRQIREAQAAKQPANQKIAYLVTVHCHTLKELKLLERLLKENEFEHSLDKIID